MEERDKTAVGEEHQTNDDGDGSVNDVPSTSARGRKSYTMKLRILSSNKSKTVKECGVCCYYLQSFSVLLVVPGCVTCAEL